ncbi:MAG: T9SS type A sorting domain-containing protein [bacterium]|nr:MAG: T9SS type A sorting domain-containing protein [bacterium]
MYIFRLYIFIAMVLLCIFLSLAKNSWSWENYPIFFPNGINGGTRLSGQSNQNDTNSAIKLIQPDSASQITTFTPTFTWHGLKSDSSVEYRLIIAKIDGKIIFDQWIGTDTSHTITSPDYFEDLTAYYWTIYASFGNQQVQSPVWSFWIDQDVVTDLTVTDIVFVDEKNNWNTGDEIKIRAIIQNSGPINAEECFVTLYSGNINRNYFQYTAYRKTIALDTVFVSQLKMNDPQSVPLTARLPYGFNHFFICIDPAPGLRDVIYSNNFLPGIKIQTEDSLLSLKGLFIIYKNYFDPETGKRSLDQIDVNRLNQNIVNFQNYFWDHTHILQINVDTLVVERLLLDDNFTYQDNQWGYFLPPGEVSFDLSERNIAVIDYDLVFVYYSWWNSSSSWSGYSGYTIKDHKLLNKKVSFLAQPVTPGRVENEKIVIHEFLHLLDYLFEENGEHQFYSPHHRTLYTTFSKDEDYYDWILETWPVSQWYKLKKGQLVHRKETTRKFKPTKISLAPKTLLLSQNYPNPFNKVTTIIYKIPQPTSSPSTSVKVNLTIYDILANRIRTLVNVMQGQGTYRVYWDGKDQQGNEITSGIYFYELKAGKQRQVKKLLYIR